MVPARPLRPSRRSSRLWAALLGATLSIGAATWAAPAHAEMKIAVVDFARVLSQTEEGLRVQANLTRKFEKLQGDVGVKQAAFQKSKEALEKEVQAGKTPQAVLQKKAEKLQKEAEDLQRFMYDTDKEMNRARKEATDPMYNKIVEILKRIALSEGYDLIIDKTVAFYHRADMELTDRAIQMYNAGSAGTDAKPATPATKPAAPAPAPAPAAPKPGAAAPAPAPAPAKK